MKFKRVYLIGGEAGKDDNTDYVVGYRAENGMYIEIKELVDNTYRWYMVGGKEFGTLKAAKEYCESKAQKAAQDYRIPADVLFHWNCDRMRWERLNRTIFYRGCVLRSVIYHYDCSDPCKIVNHREWRITFPDGHESGFGSVKRGGDLKSLKEYIDFKIKHGEL